MHTREISVGGRTISLETGRLAKQADGAVLVRSGDTVVLVTACAAANPREGIDFLPLTVDYREYAYASGRIPGGFFKREGKPSEKEVLTSRLIDRPIRPLFASGWRHETQVIALLVSADAENDSDVLAITGASAALALSSIPCTRTIAGVRIGQVDGEFVVNPTFEQRRRSRLDLVVAGTKEAIMMVEAGAKEVSEEEMVQALEHAHAAIKEIIAGIDALAAGLGKKKTEVSVRPIAADFRREVEDKAYGPLAEAMRIKEKLENYSSVDAVLANLMAGIPEEEVERRADAKSIFKQLKESVMKDEALERGRRLDGRKFDEIRPITIEVGVLPRTHGSTVFTRGETQALVTSTLGTAEDQQKIELVDGETWKRFMLHYNFPPFSVGEVAVPARPRPSRSGPRRSRRARARPDDSPRRKLPLHHPRRLRHPRVERLVVDGVGLRRIAGDDGRGRAAQGSGRRRRHGPPHGRGVGPLRRLADIAGAEDHYGDMDFKVAGTRDGITALQMDIKVSGITTEIMRKALEQARQGRFFILDKMEAILKAPRADVSAHAPRIVTIRIPVDKIRDVIGPGGKMIRSIIERTGVKIDVEDDGRVNVASADEASAQKAIGIIQELTATPELNKTYLGKVQRITDFGAFVEIMPGLDGLLHVSEIAHYRVKDVRDELNEGDQVMVKVINIDPSGKIRLSRKALLTPEEGQAPRRGRRIAGW